MLMNIMSLVLVANAFAVGGTFIGARNEESTGNAQPVEVTLYYEALCPYCKRFIENQLYPTWYRLHKTGILKVKLHAYGNCRATRRGDRWEFHCQHGERECNLNLLTTCALSKLSEEKKVPFVYCLERYPYVQYGKYCLQTVGEDSAGTIECYGSLEGNQMQKAVGDIQGALNPRLRFVPWIVVDGQHSTATQSAVQSNMMHFVCNAYKGTKPVECNGYTDEE